MSKNAGFSTADKTWLPMHPDWPTVNVQAQNASRDLSHLQVYRLAAKLRHSDPWRFGSLESKALRRGEMFGFARIHKKKGFLYLANFGNEEHTVNAPMEFEGIPANARVTILSVGFEPETNLNADVQTSEIRVGAKHAIVMTF